MWDVPDRYRRTRPARSTAAATAARTDAICVARTTFVGALLASVGDVVLRRAHTDAAVRQQPAGERDRPLVVQDLLPPVPGHDPRYDHDDAAAVRTRFAGVLDDVVDDAAGRVVDDLQWYVRRPRLPTLTKRRRSVVVLDADRGDRSPESHRDVERVPCHAADVRDRYEYDRVHRRRLARHVIECDVVREVLVVVLGAGEQQNEDRDRDQHHPG